MANTPKIGETITTAKSGVSGVVQEVVKNASGSVRVRLSVNGTDRWTTVKQLLLPPIKMSVGGSIIHPNKTTTKGKQCQEAKP